MRRLGSATLVTLAILGFGPGDAAACTCIGPATFAETYERAANVFTAVVTAEEYVDQADETTIARSKFTVTERFKGELPFEVIESYPGNVCGIWLDVGIEYLFFVADSGLVGACSATREVAHSGPEIAALRSLASGERSDLPQPWSFKSSGDGCTAGTTFDAAGEPASGALTFDVARPRDARVPAFDSAELRVLLAIDKSRDRPSLTVDGTTYRDTASAPNHPAMYLRGEDAVAILRKAMNADSLHLAVDKEAPAADLDIEVSTVSLTQAGTGAKLLECMTTPAVVAEPRPPPASEAFGLRAESPYVPGFDRPRVGDSLDEVRTAFPKAVRNTLEGGWLVRLDHPVFSGILYSYVVPTHVDESRSRSGTINRILYMFNESTPESAAEFRDVALRTWPSDERETSGGGYRIAWRDFDGLLVTLDSGRLVISADFVRELP